MTTYTVRIIALLSILALSSCKGNMETIPGKRTAQQPPAAQKALTVNQAILADIKQKNIDLSRWSRIGNSFPMLQHGMSRVQVYDLLGEPDQYPEDKSRVVQYNPDGDFSGGSTGPDWSLKVHFTDDKVSKVIFTKFIFGPPPG